jgi:hypothetical protein
MTSGNHFFLVGFYMHREDTSTDFPTRSWLVGSPISERSRCTPPAIYSLERDKSSLAAPYADRDVEIMLYNPQ